MSQNYKEKLFTPKALDIEQIILNSINEIMLCPSKVTELGDYTKVNAMQEGLVLNLDAFVSRVLLAEENAEESEYQKKRVDLIAKWPAVGSAKPELVLDLFKLIIEEVQRRRLFKVRRYTYFGMGWKNAQKVDLSAIEKQEEVEGEEPGEEAGTDEN